MNRQLVKDYLLMTFAIMILFWGGAAIISQTVDFTENNILLQVMHVVGGFSPTIASYISLKKNKRVPGFKDWLKQSFDVKHSVFTYVLVLLFVCVYYIIGCAINGFTLGAPVYMLLVFVPMMLAGGGNEEVGWRMILQPELEKSLHFHAATIITGIIWWLWHLPMFFVKGISTAETNLLLFGLMCLSLSYAFATVRKISGGTFPCILAHCLINGASAVFLFDMSLLSCAVTLLVTIIVSMIVLHFSRSGRMG